MMPETKKPRAPATRSPHTPKTPREGLGLSRSGLSAGEVMRAAVKNRRERLINEGKEDFKTFVDSETKDGLQKLKIALNVKTTGDVLDALVRQELTRRNIP